MKCAVIGTGNTGHHLLELLAKEDVVGPFNTSNPPTLKKLQEAAVIIVFVPGSAVAELTPLLVEAGRPVVMGSTGVVFPKELGAVLEERGIPWITGSNFSKGALLQYFLAKFLAGALSLWDNAEGVLEEIHHPEKKDSPSGTAKKLIALFKGRALQVVSRREKEAKGTHTLTFDTGSERLSIGHQTFDRRVYAEGALWVAHDLIWDPSLKGICPLEEVVYQRFRSIFEKEFMHA